MNKKANQFQTETEGFLNIRRCHICQTVNECQNSDVERCSGCYKSLTPFFFCESTYTDEIKELSKAIFSCTNTGLKSIYPPLVGIALYWY